AVGADGRVGGEQVGAHAVGDRYDSGGRFDRHPLAPGRQGVAAAELLGLPGTQRLQRVDGHHVRDAVQGGGQVAGQVRVPGVAVHHVGRAGPVLGGAHRRHHRQVGRDRAQGSVRAGEAFPGAVRDRALAVGALAVHGQVDQVGQLAGQVLDVHARAAVDLRRILPGQQRDIDLAECLLGRCDGTGPGNRPPGTPRNRAGQGVTTWPLPTTVMPPADTTKPRALSCSLSTPTTAPSGTSTFLSRIAFWTTAYRPILVLCMTTDRSTRDQLLTRTPGESTESRTRPPETITPLLTTLLIARPTRSPLSCTNLAGGWEGTWVRIGH